MRSVANLYKIKDYFHLLGLIHLPPTINEIKINTIETQVYDVLSVAKPMTKNTKPSKSAIDEICFLFIRMNFVLILFCHLCRQWRRLHT